MMLGRGGEHPARLRLRLTQLRARPAQSALRARLARTRLRAGSLVLRGVAISAALVVVGGTLAAYVIYRSDWNAVRRINVIKDLGTRRPPADPNALNILLIGSDSRGGSNKRFGAEVVGQRSDTVMVLHIAPGARHVVVLSFPRDSVVPILACEREAGAPGQVAQPAGDVEQLNATFAYGGPGCLWKTLEETTGIHINDFIELTFTGFEHLINDIGGVSVCLPVAVNDPDSRLHLSAGRHHISGPQALAFWRARYIGEGSDLQRIRRDQFLMASLLHGIQHSGLAHSPSKILRVIQDVVGNGYVTTDTQLTPGRLISISDELRGLPASAVQFIETPTVPYPADPLAWVQWAKPQASTLFAAVAHDSRLPSAKRHARHLVAAVEAAARLIRNASLQRDPTLAPGTIQHILGSTFTTLTPASTRRSPGTTDLARWYGGITGNVSICGDAGAFSGPDGNS